MSVKINPSDYSPPNVNYWGDRCCKAEAEIERLRAEIEVLRVELWGNNAGNRTVIETLQRENDELRQRLISTKAEG